MKNCKKGRPSTWGNYALIRPRLPIEIVMEIDKIREKFESFEDAISYVLFALRTKPEMQSLKLYNFRMSATPGVTGIGDGSSEEREIPLLFVENPKKSFLVQVAGDSMEDAGIYDNDLILVEKIDASLESLSDRSIVTAFVDDQMLVKRYRLRQGYHELVSENSKKAKDYPPICISPDMSEHHSIFIFGVYRRTIPKTMLDFA
ncbi:LexA family protein [Sphaerothrix gracilis]|uniref:LexA family protein n=1 Tax=Sphaerothrix gracilis TaxID=3151835 RepID=UPI0031FC2B42